MSDNDPNEIRSKTSPGKNKGGILGILGAAALIALVIGAIGSLVFMFCAGQNTPRFLVVLFTIWVLSPFAALLWINTVSKSWSGLTREAVYSMMFIVALGSLAIYGEWIDIRPAGSANAFLFVVVPPASLIFVAIVISIAAFISGRLSRPGDGD